VEIEPSWEEQGLKRRVPEKKNQRVTDFFRYVWPELKDLVWLDYWTRREITKNPNCSVEVLTQLALDKDSDVRSKVASNPNCPPADIMADLYLEQFTKSATPTYARLIDFRCPTGALAKNYRSRDWLERCAIAEPPKTPDATLKKLLLDGNRLVRQKAQTNLEQRKNLTPED
jgi:hypothetical protein